MFNIFNRILINKLISTPTNMYLFKLQCYHMLDTRMKYLMIIRAV